MTTVPEPSASVRSASVRAQPRPQPGELDAAAIATAVEACPSVNRLSGGVAGEIATYLPGSRVNGVRVRPDNVTVSVVANWDVPARRVGDEVRAAVRRTAAINGAGVGQIDVVIDDVEIPPELAEELGLTEPEPEPEPAPQLVAATPSEPARFTGPPVPSSSVTSAGAVRAAPGGSLPPPLPGPSSSPATPRP